MTTPLSQKTIVKIQRAMFESLIIERKARIAELNAEKDTLFEQTTSQLKQYAVAIGENERMLHDLEAQLEPINPDHAIERTS